MNSVPKQAEHVISLDIGSTFTKAALFRVDCELLKVEQSVCVPTTESLEQGVVQTIEALGCLDKQSQKPMYPVYFSSSAKGGLHVIAVGIVPELTLKVAKLTALSAGARITRSFGYKLTTEGIQEIDRLNPDIILFNGGTDGGNETYVRHNASLLSDMNGRPQIIYAGNNILQDEVKNVLSDFSVHAVSNVLPELNQPNFQETRDKIRDVFLETIVSGKGLDEVIDLLGGNPLPTPLAVMELVEAIRECCPDWTDFCVIDMGGATTDCYSSSKDCRTDPNVIYRGIAEPQIKRTVEGDLGVRINAPSVLIAGSEYLQATKSTDELLGLMEYSYKITQETKFLPKDHLERTHDLTLSEICVIQSLKRHVGIRKRVFTANGELFVQIGKDLRSVQKIILAGGFFCNLTEQENLEKLYTQMKTINTPANDQIYLVPQDVEYYQDKKYLLPLLGNLVRTYPSQASQTAISNLVSLKSSCRQTMENTC